jgi:hypothetical protein
MMRINTIITLEQRGQSILDSKVLMEQEELVVLVGLKERTALKVLRVLRGLRVLRVLRVLMVLVVLVVLVEHMGLRVQKAQLAQGQLIVRLMDV